MEEVALQVRTFVYTMICFQCLIQLSAGNSFYKYLKLFSQLLALCICCNIFGGFIGGIRDGWEQADKIYEEWQAQWSNDVTLSDVDGQLEKQIMEMSMDEFEIQINEILETEGQGEYMLKDVIQEGEQWRIVLVGKTENAMNFMREFKEKMCQQFSLQEEELEVEIV